jgi:[ribosomal protein S18]-alanine N-acetyltransferase
MADLVIRRMAAEDVGSVHEIDTLSFSLPWPERSYQFELKGNPTSRCWVAEQDGRIVAMLVLWVIMDEVHIATIAVHPDYRRRGIGERILLHSLHQAQTEGARRAFLEVRAGNETAKNLYIKYGFIVDGVRKQYYKDNQEDAILMSCDDLADLPILPVEQT